MEKNVEERVLFKNDKERLERSIATSVKTVIVIDSIYNFDSTEILIWNFNQIETLASLPSSVTLSPFNQMCEQPGYESNSR